MAVEGKLAQQKISSILTHTSILLFKAMLQDTRFNTNDMRKLHEYSLTLKYNNIETILKNKSNIKLIKIKDAHHGNILNQEKLIVSEILSSNSSI